MKRQILTFLLSFVFIVVMGGLSGQLSLAPRAEPVDSPIVEELKKGKKNGSETFEHSLFDELVSEHVDYQTGRIDYESFQSDSDKLKKYLNQLKNVELSRLTSDSAKALLINAYNAFTIKLILTHYPEIESIRDLEDPWETQKYNIGGYTLSLDDIEHGLIRPIYKDPRIHFAVNCASISCPPLADFAYTGKKIDEQLERATRRTVRDEDYIELKDGQLEVTRILKWYGDDFTREDFEPRWETIQVFIQEYASPSMRKALRDQTPQISYKSYDWSLNLK